MADVENLLPPGKIAENIIKECLEKHPKFRPQSEKKLKQVLVVQLEDVHPEELKIAKQLITDDEARFNCREALIGNAQVEWRLQELEKSDQNKYRDERIQELEGDLKTLFFSLGIS
jgi:uncharacterized protein YnzC (UPF0291/DUF896 family)